MSPMNDVPNEWSRIWMKSHMMKSHINDVTHEWSRIWMKSHMNDVTYKCVMRYMNEVTCEWCHIWMKSHMNEVAYKWCHIWMKSHMNEVAYEWSHIWMKSHMNEVACEWCPPRMKSHMNAWWCHVDWATSHMNCRIIESARGGRQTTSARLSSGRDGTPVRTHDHRVKLLLYCMTALWKYNITAWLPYEFTTLLHDQREALLRQRWDSLHYYITARPLCEISTLLYDNLVQLLLYCMTSM